MSERASKRRSRSRSGVGMTLFGASVVLAVAGVWWNANREARESALTPTIDSRAPRGPAADEQFTASPTQQPEPLAQHVDVGAVDSSDDVWTRIRNISTTVDTVDLKRRRREAKRTDFALSIGEMDAILEASDILIDEHQKEAWRSNAAKQLGGFGHACARPALLAVLSDDDDDAEIKRIKQTCVVSLSYIADKRSIDPLIDVLADDDLGILASDQLLKLLPAGKEWDGGYFGTHDPAVRREIQDKWRAWWSENREQAVLDFERVWVSD